MILKIDRLLKITRDRSKIDEKLINTTNMFFKCSLTIFFFCGGGGGGQFCMIIYQCNILQLKK